MSDDVFPASISSTTTSIPQRPASPLMKHIICSSCSLPFTPEPVIFEEPYLIQPCSEWRPDSTRVPANNEQHLLLSRPYCMRCLCAARYRGARAPRLVSGLRARRTSWRDSSFIFLLRWERVRCCSIQWSQVVRDVPVLSPI